MKKTLLCLILGFSLALGCSVLKPQHDAFPVSATNQYVLNPEISAQLTALKETQLPYVSELAALALAGLTGYIGIRNRKLKKAAVVLTQNVSDVLDDSTNREQSLSYIKERQNQSGTRDTIKRLL